MCLPGPRNAQAQHGEPLRRGAIGRPIRHRRPMEAAHIGETRSWDSQRRNRRDGVRATLDNSGRNAGTVGVRRSRVDSTYALMRRCCVVAPSDRWGTSWLAATVSAVMLGHE